MIDSTESDESPLCLSQADVRWVQELENKLQLIRDRVSGVAHRYHTGCYLVGRPGSSKTFTARETLEIFDVPWVYQNARMTPMGLFRFLDEHPRHILVLDDIASRKRPRRTYEEILWFAKTHDPYVDIKACGRWSDSISFRGSTRFGVDGDGQVHKGQYTKKRSGQTRIADVISVPVAKIERGIAHPAMFPAALAERLIRTFCPPEGIVLDCFAGSGSTLVAAKRLGHDYYGFDIMDKFCRTARRWLSEAAGLRPKAG